jgi:hypothetical protein
LVAQKVKDIFFGGEARNMSGYYDTCSYGQVKVEDEAQLKVVVDLVIPCSGTLIIPFIFPTTNNFDTKSCGNDNMLKWQYHLDSVVRAKGIEPTDYNHKIILLPNFFTGKSKRWFGTAWTRSGVGKWAKHRSLCVLQSGWRSKHHFESSR